MNAISDVREDSPFIVRKKAVKIDIHPAWNLSAPFSGSDLAVIRLDSRLELTSSVSPACLPLTPAEDQILSEVHST